MNIKMWVRIVALLTIVLGLIMLFQPGLFGPEGYQITRYAHAILGIGTIVLLEMALSRNRRSV